MSLTGTREAGGSCLGDLEDDDAVWLVTAAAEGLPRAIADASLRAGRRVVATAPQLDDLRAFVARPGAVPIALDLDDELADREIVEEVVRHFGRIDVVVLHSGTATAYLTTPGEALARVQSGLFSALWIAEAALAHMARAGRGHFVHVIGPGVSALSPHALEVAIRAIDDFSERLALEAARFGIGTTIFVPQPHYDRWHVRTARRTYCVVPVAPYSTS